MSDYEDFRSDDDIDWEPEPEANDDLGRDVYERDPLYVLPRGWQRLTDAKLETLRSELADRAGETSDDDEADDLQSAIDDIDSEFAQRRAGPDLEPVDYDDQDHRAAAEERIENQRRER